MKSDCLFTPAAPQAWESCVLQEWRRFLWQCLQQPVWSALLALAARLNWQGPAARETSVPGWALHQPTTESRGCSPAAVSRAAQGDLLPLTSCNEEKNNSGYPEERGGESLTVKSRTGSFLLSCLLQGLWQTGCFIVVLLLLRTSDRCTFLERASERFRVSKKTCHLSDAEFQYFYHFPLQVS